MKSIAFGTAALVFTFQGLFAARASNVAEDFTTKSIPTQSVLQTKDDPFLIVDKGEPGTSQNSSVQSSVESSGSPADTSGVPVPRAGWFSFVGLLGVIALRQFTLSRRRIAGNARY